VLFRSPGTTKPSLRASAVRDMEEEATAATVISNEFLQLTFDGTSNLLSTLTNKVSGVTISVSQEWLWYNSTTCNSHWGHQPDGSDGDNQNSGAYIFRPNNTVPYPVSSSPVTITVNRGPVVQEVVQTFSDWISQTVRLYAGQPFAEVEWIVGPVPIGDNNGKEVITRFNTNVSSAGYVYTDSNGREFLTRLVNYRPSWSYNITEPVAGNYYPVNAAAYLKDANSQFTVLVDRSEAGASINDGSVEFMVHRRLLYDDSRGVGEPLNETTGITPYPNPVREGTGLVIKGTYRLLLDAPETAAAGFRPQMDEVYNPPVQFYTPLSGTPAAWSASHLTSYTGLANPSGLPVNVHLLTLDALSSNVFLVRVAHQFAVGEDATLSQPTSVSLADIFPAATISSVTEVSLTTNQPVSAVAHRMGLVGAAPVTAGAPTVTLNPMQIRTFEVTIAPAKQA